MWSRLTAVAFVVAIGAELLSASHWSPDAHPSQLELVTDALIGLSFLLVGIVVWDSRPGMRVGLLMYATGLAFFIGNLSASAVPLVHHLGMALPGLWLVGLGVLVLAYPGDRLEHRVDRVLAVVALAWVVLSGVGLVTQLDPTRCVPAVCPANPFRIDVGVNLAPAFATAATLGGVLWALVGVRLVQRWWNASPSTRRALTPLWAAAGVMAISTVGKAVLDVAVGDHPGALLFDVLPMLVPIALGAGVLRARIDQASVGDLVVRLGADPADEELADAVARAAGDPSLVLAIPDADGQLVDVRGQVVASTGSPSADDADRGRWRAARGPHPRRGPRGQPRAAPLGRRGDPARAREPPAGGDRPGPARGGTGVPLEDHRGVGRRA